MKYVYAKKINASENTGIVDIQNKQIICICNESQSKLLLAALEFYEKNNQVKTCNTCGHMNEEICNTCTVLNKQL